MNVSTIPARAFASIHKDLIRAPASLDTNWAKTELAQVNKPNAREKTFAELYFALYFVDVDECLSSPCPVECINSPGSYTCLCPFGYEFDDNVCKGSAIQLSILGRNIHSELRPASN